MLRNNVELDLKTKLIEGEMSQTEIADKLGVTVRSLAAGNTW